MVHTPVGVRCPDCAQLRRLPTFDVAAPTLARAIAAGLVLGAAAGVALVFISPLLFRVPFLPFIALAALGFAVGEGISLAVNRRRGRALKIVAVGAMLVAFAIVSLFGFPFFSLNGLLALLVGAYIASSRF